MMHCGCLRGGNKFAFQFEVGQQKAGNYYCFVCGVYAE